MFELIVLIEADMRARNHISESRLQIELWLRGFLENLFLHKLDRCRRWRRQTDVNQFRIMSHILFVLSKTMKIALFGPRIRQIIPENAKDDFFAENKAPAGTSKAPGS